MQKKDHLSRITTHEWRENFLAKLDSLVEFTELVEITCQKNQHPRQDLDIASLNAKVSNIISAYDKEELAAARQYYNNEHLLYFWEYFQHEQERLISHGTINQEFPLFSTRINYENNAFEATPISVMFFSPEQLKFSGRISSSCQSCRYSELQP